MQQQTEYIPDFNFFHDQPSKRMRVTALISTALGLILEDAPLGDAGFAQPVRYHLASALDLINERERTV